MYHRDANGEDISLVAKKLQNVDINEPTRISQPTIGVATGAVPKRTSSTSRPLAVDDEDLDLDLDIDDNIDTSVSFLI